MEAALPTAALEAEAPGKADGQATAGAATLSRDHAAAAAGCSGEAGTDSHADARAVIVPSGAQEVGPACVAAAEVPAGDEDGLCEDRFPGAFEADRQPVPAVLLAQAGCGRGHLLGLARAQPRLRAPLHHRVGPRLQPLSAPSLGLQTILLASSLLMSPARPRCSIARNSPSAEHCMVMQVCTASAAAAHQPGPAANRQSRGPAHSRIHGELLLPSDWVC